MHDSPDPWRQRLAGRDAGTLLYDTFSPRIFRRLGQRYPHLSAADREDVVQETFLVVLRHEARLLASFLAQAPAALSEAALERFLWDQACGIASNRRKSSWRRLIPFPAGLEPVSRRQEEAAAIDRDLLRQLDACILANDPRAHLYYKLRYRDGLSPQEIVQMIGWPRRSTYRLRQTLDKVLRRCAEKLGLGGG
jgi:DNA-directed RNA polymerase specialized sigma24 family protein